MTDQPRQPKGSPAGGEFTAMNGAESDTRLTPEPAPLGTVRWEETVFEGNDLERHATSTAQGSAGFDLRVRLLLGVGPDEPFTATMENDAYNPWGCETWEGSETVTFASGDKVRTFDSLYDALNRLEAVDPTGARPETQDLTVDDFSPHIGKQIYVVAVNGELWEGRVGNTGKSQILLIGDQSLRGVGRCDKIDGEWFTWVTARDIDRFHPSPLRANLRVA